MMEGQHYGSLQLEEEEDKAAESIRGMKWRIGVLALLSVTVAVGLFAYSSSSSAVSTASAEETEDYMLDMHFYVAKERQERHQEKKQLLRTATSKRRAQENKPHLGRSPHHPHRHRVKVAGGHHRRQAEAAAKPESLFGSRSSKVQGPAYQHPPAIQTAPDIPHKKHGKIDVDAYLAQRKYERSADFLRHALVH